MRKLLQSLGNRSFLIVLIRVKRREMFGSHLFRRTALRPGIRPQRG